MSVEKGVHQRLNRALRWAEHGDGGGKHPWLLHPPELVVEVEVAAREAGRKQAGGKSDLFYKVVG